MKTSELSATPTQRTRALLIGQGRRELPPALQASSSTRSASEPAGSIPTSADATRVRVGGRALVVERSRRTRLVIREALAVLEPTEILSFDEVDEAVEELRRQPVSVLVVGMVDKDGKGTALLLERVRRDRLVPEQAIVVAVSAERSSRHVMSLVEHAPDACVLKPVDALTLARRLLDAAEVRHRMRPLMTLLENDRFEAARQLCRAMSAERSAQAGAAWRALVDWLIGQGRHDPVPALVDEAMRAGTQPWMLIALARCRLAQDRLSEAREILDLLLDLWPDTIVAYDLSAQVAVRQGQHQEALGWLMQAGHRTRFNLGRARAIGQEANLAGDLKAAEQAYSEIVATVGGTDLIEADDALQLVSVLGARGRLGEAARVAAQESLTMGDGPDGKLTRALLAQRRAARDGGPLTAERALTHLLDELSQVGVGASPRRTLEVIAACLAHGWRADALRIARELLDTERASPDELEQLREMLRH